MTNNNTVLALNNKDVDALLFAIDEGIEIASLKYNAAKENFENEEDIEPYRERLEILKSIWNKLSGQKVV